MSTWAQTRCPITGDNSSIPARLVRLVDHGGTFTYTYPCPSCGDQHHKPAGRDVRALLAGAGVPTVTLTGGELDDPARTSQPALGLLEVDKLVAALEGDYGPYLAAAAYRPATDADLLHVVVDDPATPTAGGDSITVQASGRRTWRRCGSTTASGTGSPTAPARAARSNSTRSA